MAHWHDCGLCTNGRIECLACFGEGHDEDDFTCEFCEGDGGEHCDACEGEGGYYVESESDE